MIYVGIDWSTALISTSFPDRDIVFSPQPLICFQTRSRLIVNTCSFDILMIAGIPKNLSCWETTWTPKSWPMWFLFAVEVPLLNVIEDFSKLIACPDALAYKSRIPFSADASSSVALQKIIVSSAKHNVDTDGADGAILTPCIWSKFSAWAIRAIKASTTHE